MPVFLRLAVFPRNVVNLSAVGCRSDETIEPASEGATGVFEPLWIENWTLRMLGRTHGHDGGVCARILKAF
ncbi:MAG: hypothetical protein ACO1OG_10820 [Devosia sp.]